MKISKSKLKQIIMEEIEEMRTDGRRQFSVAQKASSDALAAAGIASRPNSEKIRRELLQIVSGLDVEDPLQIQQLAKMVSQLMDASAENIRGGYGLEEMDQTKQTEEPPPELGDKTATVGDLRSTAVAGAQETGASGITPKERGLIQQLAKKLTKGAEETNLLSGEVIQKIKQLAAVLDKAAGE